MSQASAHVPGYPELVTPSTVRWIGRARYTDGALAQCLSLARLTGARLVAVPTWHGATVYYDATGRYIGFAAPRKGGAA